MDHYYFAYGSNMHPEQMKRRCPDAQWLGVAHLSGHRLRFNKFGQDRSAKANIISTQSPSDRTLGILYQMAPKDWPRLDEFERGYERLVVQVQLNENSQDCLTYMALEPFLCSDVAPSLQYVRTILEAAKLHAFPQDYLAYLEKEIYRWNLKL